MKNFIGIALFTLLFLSGCSTNDHTASAQLAESFSSIEELSEATPIIVIGKVSGENEEFQHRKTTFVRTPIQIEEVIRNH